MSSKPANYSEFFDLPTTWTRAVWGDKHEGGDRQLINDADPYKWSGDGIPPKIGAKVHCYLNGIGPCVVLKYFVEYGWLGVVCEVKKNPAWRKKQDNGVNVPAHLFGLDLEPRKPIAPVVSHLAGHDFESKPVPVKPSKKPRQTDLFD